jgi:hypothetical protein
MSKPKKNSVKSQGGDPFTRWLVIGMVTLVVVVGAVFSLTSENKAKDAAFTALDSFQSLGAVPASVDSAAGDGIVFNPGLPTKIDIFEDFQCPVCKMFEERNLQSPFYSTFPTELFELILYRTPSPQAEVQQITLLPATMSQTIDPYFIKDLTFSVCDKK